MWGIVTAAVRTFKFMPKPAEIRVLAIGDTEDLAEQAWLNWKKAARIAGAYASIATDDPALGEALVSIFGGWPEACLIELSPEMWAAKRKEFGRVYRVMAERRLVGPRYLPGLCERANAGQPDWMRFVELHVLDGRHLKLLAFTDAETYRAQLSAQAGGFKQLEAEVIVDGRAST